MALIIADRVKETTITEGTGTITLSGPTFGGFQSFSSAIGEGNTTYYCIQNESNFEIGVGTYSSGTLSRDTVIESSNSGAKISITGVAVVFGVVPSTKLIYKNENGDFVITGDVNVDDVNADLVSANSGDFGSILSNGIESSGLLTLTREDAGSFFHAYVDDSNDRTISLHSDAAVAPTWKLGLKNSPSSETDAPAYAYVYGSEGSIGLVGNSDNQITISNSSPFIAKHQGVDVITAHYVTGVHLQSNSSAYPALIVNGGAALSADIQRWNNNAGTTLSVVDNAGNFGIRNSNPSYQLDVTGTGNFSQSIRFGDGTVQSTAYVNSSGELQSLITLNDSRASGLIASTSGSLQPQITTNTAASGSLQSQITSNAAVSGVLQPQITTNAAVSGVLQSQISDIESTSVLSGVLQPQITINAAASGSLQPQITSNAAVSGSLQPQITSNAAVSGSLQPQITENASDIVTVSGLLGSSSSVSGILFETSGSNDEFRIGTIFIDPDGTQQTVRASDFNGGFLRLEVARFSPSVSANGQSRSWDQPVTQWTVTVDNPTDFTTNYVSGVKSPLTGITGSVTSDVTLYSTSGPSVTPGGGVDWTQTFSTDGDSPIYSSTNDLTGGSASATVSFLDKNQATISETATITFNWSTASNSIAFANLSGKNFLERYTTTTYNLTINNISDLSNTSTAITTNAGTLTSSTGDGTITFTTPIHKDNNSGRTITATTDFTRPATVTGTEYTSQDVSSDSNITATFTYPSFYIFTSSTSNPPSRADIVDSFDFDSANVTELSNELKVIDQQINNPDGVPKCWWFAVRSAASQPTTFKTGSDASLLVGVTPTETTVDLEPDIAPVGYNSEEYKLYGITLNPGNTYVQIS